MARKTGRNDPCPCGSGRKFKHCHGRRSAQATKEDQTSGVAVALRWLDQRHPKAFKAELEYLTMDAFWPQENPDPTTVPGEFWEMIAINVQEWALASGELTLKGQRVPIRELILGPGGPKLNDAQQQYLRQLASQPLRWYQVTDARPGEGLTLVDLFDPEADPIRVRERTASRTLKAGDTLGARTVEVGDQLELSGAVYPFTTLHTQSLLGILPNLLEDLRAEGLTPAEFDFEVAHWLVEQWFAQITLPAPVPQFVDASSGEPLMLTTDHFRILDRAALDEKLDNCGELEESGDDHWVWYQAGADGLLRPRLSLSIEPESPDRIELFCRTRKLADAGREWFEALAGDSVKHLTRELTDPQGALSSGQSKPAGKQARVPLPDIPPAEMSRIIRAHIEQTYANWADEPIPALDHRSPRQAITTPAGLERVKGLLRSYEQAELGFAREQGRDPVSFRFLWDALGLTPD